MKTYEVKINSENWETPNEWALENKHLFKILHDIDFGHHLTKQRGVGQLSETYRKYSAKHKNRSVKDWKEFWFAETPDSKFVFNKVLRSFRKYIAPGTVNDETLEKYLNYSLFKFSFDGFEAENLIIETLNGSHTTSAQDNSGVDMVYNHQDYQIKSERGYEAMKNNWKYKGCKWITYNKRKFPQGIFEFTIID